MMWTSAFPRAMGLAALLLVSSGVACGGKTSGEPGGPGASGSSSGGLSQGGGGGSSQGGSSGSSQGGSSGSSQGGSSGAGGEVCVEVSTSNLETSCQSDGDCTTVPTGQVCSDTCYCGGDTPINVSSKATWQQEVSGLPQNSGPCSCPLEIPPRCLDGTCGFCKGLPSDPPACGTTAIDAGVGDAAACVYIPASAYTTACNVSSDCTSLAVGQVCSGTCADCGGIPVNVSGTAVFDMATAGLTFAACFCPAREVACVGGTCVDCSLPGACPDGG